MLEGHSDSVYSVAVNAKGQRAVSASADATLKVWDLDNKVPLATFTCDAEVRSWAFIGNDKLIAGDAGGVHPLA